MKRLLPILLVCLAVLGAFIAYRYSRVPAPAGFNGYVEGEFTRIAPTTAGTLEALYVERGGQVHAGDRLFSLDVTKLEADDAAAQALLAQATASWQDLTKGKRPEEIDAIMQQQAQAQATLTKAKKEWDRIQALASRDSPAVSKAQLDSDRAAYEAAVGRVNELEAQLKTATLGARVDQIAAARAAVDEAAQKVAQAEKTLKEAAPVAPADAAVEDTYYRRGEQVAANAPVVSLLAPVDVKIRFFVPESVVPRLPIGKALRISCDGCAGGIAATVSFVADQAEYTPPVIYSVESRQKLVFMIEARPDKFDPRLRPGLPVTINFGSP